MFPVKLSETVKPCGAFGAIRKFDIHTGLDLYCEVGAQVKSLTDGVVREIRQFTGEAVGSPWWNKTSCVVIGTENYDILYGELWPFDLSVGQVIKVGDTLGFVQDVLKTNKGKTPTSMIHLEFWESGTCRDVVWELGTDVPSGLLDPRDLFSMLTITYPYWLIKTKCGYKLEDNSGNYLMFFHMAADSKAYCQSKGLNYKYLKEGIATELQTKYYIATGKFLWWNI